VILYPKKRETEIWYKVRPKTKYTGPMIHERPVFIRGKWMKDEDSFIENLKAICDERSIPFSIVN